MNVNLQLRLSTDDHSWLCFRHAILEALRGREVEIEIDDYTHDSYIGPTICKICYYGSEVGKEKEDDNR